MTEYVLHRQPASVNRERQNCDHVTAPRRAWYESEKGKQLIIRRQLEGELGFYIGKAINCTDGRQISRPEPNVYEVRGMGYGRHKFKTLAALIEYLQAEVGTLSIRSEISLYGYKDESERLQESKYHGTSYQSRDGGRWKCELTVNKKRIYLGLFDTQEKAARAYDAYVIAHGLNRPLNFPPDVQLEDVA